MTYICLGRKVSKVEKFRLLQTCHSYNESATVSFKVSFQFLVLVVSRTLVVLVYYDTCYERDGINRFRSLKNSNEVLNKSKSKGFKASTLSSYISPHYIPR